MVSFKKGVITVGSRDFLKCPFCRRVKVDGKIAYSQVTLVAVSILPKVEGKEFMAMPYIFSLLEEPSILLPSEPDRTAYDGPGLQMQFVCEHGHEWLTNVCMHQGRAIQFVEVMHSPEPEIEEPEIAEEEEDE